MVEFAVVIPLLLLVVIAIIQVGSTFKDYLTLVDSVRSGARVAAVSRQDASPAAEAIARVRDAAGDLSQGSLDVQVNSTWVAGSDVTVTATYPYQISVLGMVVQSGQLKSTTKERVE
jgi:Flp pilus assembly protein TadG